MGKVKKEMNQDDVGYTDVEIHAMESASDLLQDAQDNVTQANQVIEENMEEAYGLTDRISTIQEWLTETIGLLDRSLHKSSTKKSKIKKAFLSWNASGLQSALGDAEYAYMEWHDSGVKSNDDESRLYNEIESDIDELTDKINEYIGVLNDLMAGHEDDYEASTKKSKVKKSITDKINTLERASDKLDEVTDEIFEAINNDDGWTEGEISYGSTRLEINTGLSKLFEGQEIIDNAIEYHNSHYRGSTKKSQNTTKSFNSMVQDIRSKNNTKRVM